MKKYTFITLVAIFTAMLMVTAQAFAMPVDEIVQKANLAAYYGGDDGKAGVKMIITDSQGRKRTREFTILRRDVKDGGDQKFYVYFKKPADVRGMVFMVHKKVNGDDDRWLYLPALDLVKRIAASDKRTSFVGSNFVYEDVSGRTITEDIHELTQETDSHFVLKNIPKDPGGVEFSSYTVWIDKKTFLPVKAEYLDKTGKPYRLVEAVETKVIKGIPTVTVSRVKDITTGAETVSTFSKITYNTGLKDSIFTERYLRRPPRQARR